MMFVQLKVANTYLGAVTENPNTVFPGVPQVADGTPTEGVYVNLTSGTATRPRGARSPRRSWTPTTGRGPRTSSS